MSIYFNDGTSSSNKLILCDYVAGTSDVTVINGPVSNGCIIINANSWYDDTKMGWKITIEAID